MGKYRLQRDNIFCDNEGPLTKDVRGPEVEEGNSGG